MGLHFDPLVNTSHYLDVLLAAAANNSEKFSVYTPQTMPERYHFTSSSRIAPIYIVPNIGYVLTTRKEGDVGLSKGVCNAPQYLKHILTICVIRRTMVMTTMNLLCAPYLLPMAPFLLWRRLLTIAEVFRVGSGIPTKPGTQPRTILT